MNVLECADTVDSAGISTWVNAVEGIKEKGGKATEFQGTRDPVCHPIEVLALQHRLT
jgi:hypothetical protein